MGNLLDQQSKFNRTDFEWKNGGTGCSDGDKNGRKEIDCSHLLYRMMREAGYNVTYESTSALAESRHYEVVAQENVRPGDIVLWNTSKVHHTGVVVSYNPADKKGTFFGSQNKTGPAVTDFGQFTNKGWAMPPTMFLRPKENFKAPDGNPLPPGKSMGCPPPPPSKELFNLAETIAPPPRRRDPLILDLDGDGIETVSINDGAHFDHNNDGFAEQTGWVAPDDGLLVLDWKNGGNGRIDNGEEIFGDHSPLKAGGYATDGFQALADWDDNHDGKIDAADEMFSHLQVWKDEDGDGYTSPGELHALSEYHIQTLNLTYTTVNTAVVIGTPSRWEASASDRVGTKNVPTLPNWR